MYRINSLGRNVLIVFDEVVKHAPTKHSLDPRMIENSIIIAEERFIVPALGYNFYESLIAEKNVTIDSSNKSAKETESGGTFEEGQILNAAEFLSDDNKALWDRILWKLIAECVLMIAYPEGFIQFGNSGPVHENPPAGPMTSSGLVSPDLRSIKWMMDKKMQDRINPLMESMHVWLCKQKKEDSTKYTLYCKDCGCNWQGTPYQRRTDLILGIYDDHEDDHHWRRNPNKLPGCCD